MTVPGIAGDARRRRHRGRQGRRHTWRFYALAVIVVLLVAILVSSLVSVPYYAETPGTAQPVEKLIGVPSSMSHHHEGRVLLVDVELTPLRAIEWLWFKFDSNAEIVTSGALLGTANAAQYQIEGELDMADAQQAAKVVALRELGYPVSVRDAGALVYALFRDSPGSAHLSVGEVVTSLGGKPVTNYTSLSDDLASYRPGDTITLGVASYPRRTHETVRLQLSAWRVKGKGKSATLVCPPYGTGKRYRLELVSPGKGKARAPVSCMGVELENSYRISRLPFKVNMSSEGIIGPSAGLAFTLGLMQRLDRDDLTGGHLVAATGTMSINGAVGPVGGVAQKTIAVRASGAKIFFVPKAQYKVALAHSAGKLKIYPVTSIGQVLRILERYGGKVAGQGSSRAGS